MESSRLPTGICGCVKTRAEADGRDALVLEEREERVMVGAGAESRGQQTRRRSDGGVGTADERADGGASGTGDDGVGGGKLNEIRGPDAFGFVRRVFTRQEFVIIQQATTFWTVDLRGVEEEGTVGATGRGRGEGQAEGEAARIVEGEADGGAGRVSAEPVGTKEGGC